MRTFIALSLAFVALFAVVAALPSPVALDDEEIISLLPEGAGQPEEGHFRQKRATCDLLSPFKVGHAACAAHCIAKGFRGGWCDGKAVCNCRR